MHAGEWNQVGQMTLIGFNPGCYDALKNDRKFATRYLDTDAVERESALQVIVWLMLPQLFDFHKISCQILHDMGVEVS